MLFRPNYCANCGEKIERAEWGLLTSRRFCQVCESEYKGQDLIPRFIVGIAIAIGVFGFGSYLKSSPAASANFASKKPQRTSERITEPKPKGGVEELRTVATSPANPDGAGIQKETSASTTDVRNSDFRASIGKPVTAESAYFCGAETKKGTPCSRRVKGNTRCYQHPGMPAMVAAEKLKIRQAENN